MTYKPLSVQSASTIPAALIISLAITATTVRAQCIEDCRLIHSFFGEAAGDQFGWVSEDIGDLNHDGIHDVIISSPNHDTGGNNAGRIYVYSGADGAMLFQVTGDLAGERLGSSVGNAGDVDGDGGIDFFVTAAGDSAGTGAAYLLAGNLPDAPLPARLLVAGWNSHNLLAYAAATGEDLGQLVAGGTGGLTSPHSIHLGPDGLLYVTSVGTNQVLTFHPRSGAF